MGAETSIDVKKGCAGLGIGTMLYHALEALLKQQGVLNLNACITYPNPGSVGFHKRHGFQTVAHFHQCGWKLNQWHDMIWMEKFIGEHSGKPEPFIPFPELRTREQSPIP